MKQEVIALQVKKKKEENSHSFLDIRKKRNELVLLSFFFTCNAMTSCFIELLILNLGNTGTNSMELKM